MPKRLITAVREAMGRGAGGRPVAVPYAVPAPSAPPAGWRERACRAGAYTRFTISIPHDWREIPVQGRDALVFAPSAGPELSVTVASYPVSVAGPQGLLDAVHGLGGDDEPPDPSVVRLAHWLGEAWAAAWSWEEPRDLPGARVRRLLALGTEQALVVAVVDGPFEAMATEHDLVETLLGTLRLGDAALLAPEFFLPALAELLNDRAGARQWRVLEDGRLVGPSVAVDPGQLYRRYLTGGGLEAIAAILDRPSELDPAAESAGLVWEEVQDRLRVVLRPSEAMEGLDVVQVEVAPGITACPVIDAPDRVIYVPSAEAERWGMDERSLLTRAVSRLDSDPVFQVLELREQATDDLLGVVLRTEDGYDSGRLLCPRLHSALAAELGSPLLVAMPAAAAIQVWRDDEQARAHLRARIPKDYSRRPRPLSEDLWLWTEEGLVPLGG